MTVGIVGLGLIGGSFAKVYKQKKNKILATDIDRKTMQYAMISECVDQELNQNNIAECDLILICIYPAAAIEFMETYGPFIGEKPVVIDCCGTKKQITEKGMKIAEKYHFTFVGGHPMAGTQYSGLKYARENLFHRAPMVIIPPRYDDIVLLTRIKEMLKPAGFSRITVTTAEKHDEMIAFTSQLAHVVSNAYIKSPTAREHRGMSAGSYKDMTRVAWLNPEMWTELCMDNRENLIRETDILIENLICYREALKNRDAAQLEKLFAEGKKLKEEVDG